MKYNGIYREFVKCNTLEEFKQKMQNNQSEKEIFFIEAIYNSIKSLLKENNFSSSLCERCQVGRLFHHLADIVEKEYNDVNVDIEYCNRGIDDRKELNENKNGIYPDIIVHKRQIAENFVCIEVKKNLKYKKDFVRLYSMVKNKEYGTGNKQEFKYNYKFGCYINLKKNNKTDLFWIKADS